MKYTNRLVTIFFPPTIFVDVDTDLTFLDGMPLPPDDDKLENDENLQIKIQLQCSLHMADTQHKYTDCNSVVTE